MIGSVGYRCLSLSLLFRVVIKWIWWRALGLSLDCWINESMRLESGRVGIGAIGSGGKQNQRPKQDGFEL